MTEITDISKLIEWMYRSSEQLNFLTEKAKETSIKVDGLHEDVMKLQFEVENHPKLCPLNTVEIRNMINQELDKIPENLTESTVKLLIKNELTEVPTKKLNKLANRAQVWSLIVAACALIVAVIAIVVK